MLGEMQVSQSRWFYRRSLCQNVRVRLFCLPHAGGSGQSYSDWSNALPDDIEVIGVLLPGRGLRMGERAYTRMEPLVSALADSLADLFDVPFAVFGHSLGALIAYELARTTKRRFDIEPECLIVAGCGSPDRVQKIKKHDQSDDAMIELLHRTGGTPLQLLNNREVLQFILPAVRADFELFDAYSYLPSEPLECPIVALGGTMDDLVAEEDLEAWRKHTRGPFDYNLFAGGHFFTETAERPVLERVYNCLNQVSPAGNQQDRVGIRHLRWEEERQ